MENEVQKIFIQSLLLAKYKSYQTQTWCISETPNSDNPVAEPFQLIDTSLCQTEGQL